MLSLVSLTSNLKQQTKLLGFLYSNRSFSLCPALLLFSLCSLSLSLHNNGTKTFAITSVLIVNLPVFLFYRPQLSAPQLLQLMTLLFPSPPREEVHYEFPLAYQQLHYELTLYVRLCEIQIQILMNLMYEREVEKAKADTSVKFGFIQPSYHTPGSPSLREGEPRYTVQPHIYYVLFGWHFTNRLLIL